MTFEISIDRTRCCGYGNCIVAAPDVFDLDDQDIAVIQDGHPVAGDQGVVADAAADCPVQAIHLTRTG